MHPPRFQTVLNEFTGHISVPLRCTVSCSKQITASHAIWAEGVRLLCLLPPQMVISVNEWRQANNRALWMKPSRNTISFKNSFKVHNSTSVHSIPIGCLICIQKWPNLISLKYKKNPSFFHTDFTLPHLGGDKMADISQSTFSNEFPLMKMFEFWLNFHWSLLPRVQFTIIQHWFW